MRSGSILIPTKTASHLRIRLLLQLAVLIARLCTHTGIPHLSNTSLLGNLSYPTLCCESPSPGYVQSILIYLTLVYLTQFMRSKHGRINEGHCIHLLHEPYMVPISQESTQSELTRVHSSTASDEELEEIKACVYTSHSHKCTIIPSLCSY